MPRKQKSTWQRMALVGAVGIVALIGNMRASGSPGVADAGPVVAPVASPKSQLPVVDASAKAVPGERSRHGDAAMDEVELVPAIYGWNPDVRFVYYRHVSKWM